MVIVPRRTILFIAMPLALVLLLAVLDISPRAFGADDARINSVTAGEFIVDPPTLINLGFEWMIQGDDNRDAKVEVSYRKRGEAQWTNALPLLRLQNEEI